MPVDSSHDTILTERLLCARHCAKAASHRRKLLLTAGLVYTPIQREKIHRTPSRCDESFEGMKTG